MQDTIGWLSSVILVLTISAQLQKQWRAGTSKGISKWLFIGQFVASLGFVSYSVLIDDWVFVVTNGLLSVEALLGLAIFHIHRRAAARAARTGAAGAGERDVTPADASCAS